MKQKSHKIVILLGLPGVGKTTIGNALTKNHGIAFLDCDQAIPQHLKDKISRGEMMSDEEREAYLIDFATKIQQEAQNHSVLAGIVVPKEKHRVLLHETLPDATFVNFVASESTRLGRLAGREHVFSNVAVAQQLSTQVEEIGIPHIDINNDRPVEEVVEEVRNLFYQGLWQTKMKDVKPFCRE